MPPPNLRVSAGAVLVVPPFECAWLADEELQLREGSGCVSFEVRGEVLDDTRRRRAMEGGSFFFFASSFLTFFSFLTSFLTLTFLPFPFCTHTKNRARRQFLTEPQSEP